MGAVPVARGADESFEQWARSRLASFERAAAEALPPAERVPGRLHKAMRYAALAGGKRVRPLLAYAAAEAGAGTSEVAAHGDPIHAVALAVEFVHVYSLIHDDLPCMDDDVLRRGKPTVHVAFDEATAMLAGDALQAEAFKVLAEGHLPAPQTASLMRELAHASGTEGMCGGQAIDLTAVGNMNLSFAELEQLHRMKTGALLKASVLMGALSG